MTLKDIAKRAGVSVSTVSKVLNDQNTKAAGDEVKRKIWDAVRESDYIPNANAQKLRKKNEPDSGGRISIITPWFVPATKTIGQVCSFPNWLPRWSTRRTSATISCGGSFTSPIWRTRTLK